MVTNSSKTNYKKMKNKLNIVTYLLYSIYVCIG
jgi:hypothetical protein